MKLLFFLISLSVLSSCGLIERRQGYNEYALSDQSIEPYQMLQNRKLTMKEAELLEKKANLRRLEKNLSSNEERQQYQKSKVFFKDLDDNVEFLSLPDVNSRERWLNANAGPQQRFARDIAKIIESGDIAIGMSRDAVRESWGRPRVIDYSGHKELGNERWVYQDSKPTSDGFEEMQKIVFFKAGVVVGWKTQ